jgi:type II secretory pathway pseudopilin PulG
MRAFTRFRTEEVGLTLSELLVAMVVLGLASGVFLTTLTSVQRSVTETDIRTRSNTQARLALQTLDHEVRSGNVLYDPATSVDPYFRFKIYTQANATTRQPSPGYTCRLWRITSTGELQTRWWPPNQPEDASGWLTAATGIVNKLVATPLNAFVLDPDPNKGGRTVNVLLLVNEDPQQDFDTGTVRIQSALTGRNTSYGFPTGVCAAEPAD